MQALIKKLTSKEAVQFSEQLGAPFHTLPHLPKGLVGFIVKIAPILVLISAVLSLFASPILGFLGMLSLISFNPMLVFSVFLASVIALLTALILFLAYQPLQQRRHSGWMLLFWVNMLSIVQVLYNLIRGYQGVGSIIGIFIGLYLLYELKPWYKK